MGYKVDMSLPPEDVLLNQINHENGTKFTTKSVGFRSDGIHPTTKHDRDTMVWLVAKVGQHGQRRIYYDRINLVEYLGDFKLQIEKHKYKETHELLDEVRRRMGINLTRKDIVSDVIWPGAEETVLRIHPKSLVYKGHICIDFIDMMSFRIQNRLLDGFELVDLEV